MPRSAPDYCGWGAKRGSKVRSWKNRYFVLRGRELVYYSGAKSDGSGDGVDERGRLNVVNVDYSPDRKNGLLIYGDARKKELMMTTATIEESRVLFRKIKQAIGEQETSFVQRPTGHETLGEDLIVKQGWLQKTEPLQSAPTWNRCYVVLLRGRTMEFYAAPNGFFIDRQTVVTTEADASSFLSLKLVVQQGKVIYVAAESRKEIEDWDRALAATLGLPSVLKKEAGDLDNVEANDTKDSRQTDSTAVFEGWVEKLGQRRKVWKKRYMSLVNGMLEYRKGPLEQLSAELCVTDVAYSSRYSNALVIEFGSNRSPHDRDTICIRAESSQVLDEWMRALSDALGKPQIAGFPRPSSALAGKHCSNRSQLSLYSRKVSMGQGNDKLEATSSAQVCAGTNCVKRGWLYEQVSGSSSWMLRYFVLSENALNRFEHGNEASETLGRVASVTHNTEPTGSIGVRFDDGRTLNVYGETKADTNAWYAAFCNITCGIAKDTAKEEAMFDEEEFDNDNCFRGWLLKKGQHFKTWKRRYFVLERSRLAYSAAGGGEILGSGVVFEVGVGDLRPFCIDIRFQNGRLLHVVAPTQEAFTRWLDVLKKASNLAESFLSQSNGLAIIGDDFDNDVEVSGNANDEGTEFTADDISEYEVILREGGGASSWIAAMQNHPEYDTLGPSSSDERDDADEVDIISRVSEPSPISLNELLGCVGWLRKEGGKVKSWKRRYFTLHGAKLSYYKCEKGSLLRSVNVIGVLVHPSMSKGLIVSTSGGRKLILQADTNDDSDRWLSALQRAASKVHERRSTISTALSVNDFMENALSEEVVVTHSGWLQKEGQRFKTWKKRFFTLKNSALIYYTEVGGAARGHGMVKDACQDSSRPHTLVVEFRSGKTMRVTAANEAEMSAWHQVFSKVRFSGSEAVDVGDATDVVDSDEDNGSGGESTRLSRFNPNDYLNDAISNDTFMRLCDDEGKATLLDPRNDVVNTPRSFKGELTFDEGEEEKDEMGLSTADADYYRKLHAEDKRIQRLEAKTAGKGPPISGCAPCCTMM